MQAFSESLLGRIRQEPGRLDSRLYRDAKDQLRLVFITAWETERAW